MNIFLMKTILSKLEIHYTTWLLILMALLAGYVKYIFIIFIIVIGHEIGHVITFKLFKIDIIKVIIFPFGGITYVNKKIHERIYKEIIWSLAGIVAQLILAIIFLTLFFDGYIASSTYEIFSFYNKTILLFNLLPIIPLDGSKFINSLLNKVFSFKMSFILTNVISLIILFIFIIESFVYKINNLVIDIFLFFSVIKSLKSFKYLLNKFYLERVLYNHYYNKIVSDCKNVEKMMLERYYYFKVGHCYSNERDFIKKRYFKDKDFFHNL